MRFSELPPPVNVSFITWSSGIIKLKLSTNVVFNMKHTAKTLFSKRALLISGLGLLVILAVVVFVLDRDSVNDIPDKQPDIQDVEEGEEITPPGTILITPEVPPEIEHQEPRPALGG